MSGHPATPSLPAPHAPRPDPAAAPFLDAAFEGGWSQNPVTWILAPNSANPFPAWQLSLSENCANPIEYYFYRARYYEPGVGRFTQRDPLSIQGYIPNYIYVTNNPIIFVDPKGLYPCDAGSECCKGKWRISDIFVSVDATIGGEVTFDATIHCLSEPAPIHPFAFRKAKITCDLIGANFGAGVGANVGSITEKCSYSEILSDTWTGGFGSIKIFTGLYATSSSGSSMSIGGAAFSVGIGGGKVICTVN